MNAFVRAALAGAATGARSFTGLAALTLATPPGSAAQPDRALSLPWVKGLVTLAAAQELVMDKLPQAPSRLGVMGLGARVAAGAAVGAVAARREPEPSSGATVAAVAVAVGTTVTAAWLGATWRRLAARRFGTDYVGAGAEDLFATSLAWTATRI
ncbi:MAG: hypothetical protein ABSF03_03850 [Streptosporangiaceae bacterium]